ncbi:MAG: orotate phosphoribosyltransferase [Bryobacteraceae bacterium]
MTTVIPATESVLELFRFTGAYLEGHFRLTSGLHSDRYLQCALVLEHPTAAEKLGKMLAAALQPLAVEVKVVVSPALGGLIIGHEVARALGCRHIFTERDPESRKMVLRRGFSVDPGEIACVVEDVITTGGSTKDVIAVLQEAGATVAAAGSIIDRSGGTADVGVPRVALATLSVAAYSQEECPLCQQGIRLVKPGSRPG